MKTATPALLSLLLAVSGLLLSISAQDNNATISDTSLVVLNQTIPLNSSIATSSEGASSGSNGTEDGGLPVLPDTPDDDG